VDDGRLRVHRQTGSSVAVRDDIFLPGSPPQTPVEELALHFVLTDDLRDLKFQAIAAHESQVEGLMEVFGRDLMQPLGEENFRLGVMKG